MALTVALDPALESLLAFWAEAGVDAAVEDAPTDKLRRRAPETAAEPVTTTAKAPPVRPTAGSSDLESAVETARRLARSADTLEHLISLIAGLEVGPLRPPRTGRVTFARVDPEVQVAVVGGFPGSAEAASGEAFAGAEGQLLDRMLTAAGLSGRVLRLHLTPWPTTQGEEPSPEAAASARPFLDRALELAAPWALLLLGDQAVRGVLGLTETALRLRGRPLAHVIQSGATPIPAVVTFNPGLLIKQPMAKKRAWDDLLTLSDRVVGARVAP